MLRGLFARRAALPDPVPRETERVKALARTLLGLPDEAAVTVSEIACLDPSCPGTETVVLVMVPGRRTVAAKVPAEAAAVSEQDLRSALVSAGLEVSG